MLWILFYFSNIHLYIFNVQRYDIHYAAICKYGNEYVLYINSLNFNEILLFDHFRLVRFDKNNRNKEHTDEILGWLFPIAVVAGISD